MKRWIVLMVAAAMVLSAGAIALADDHGADVGDLGELNDKQQLRAENLASYFAPRLAEADAEPDEVEASTQELLDQVVEYRTGDDRIGWGAMYKLMLLAEYRGEDLASVVADLQADGGWGFGKAFKEVRNNDEWAATSDTPKNFGQFKKQQRNAASSGD
jgi:hypothetical protein